MSLEQTTRLLMAVDLVPVQGERFQPTGFPELAAAEFTAPRHGTSMLLVESPQSMANRLEAVCWDEASQDLVPDLKGIPYVRSRLVSGSGEVIGSTASILEAHRLNSPYFMFADGGAFREKLRERAGLPEKGATGMADRRRLAEAVFYYDPNALIHGVFMEKIDGRARLQRVLSGFIEARAVQRAVSGGVKLDRANARGSSEEGYGNVPYVRTEYTAETITACFSVDLAQIRAYGLGIAATDLLVTLSLWKVRRFLDGALRLRTACDLRIATTDGANPLRTEPAGFTLPDGNGLATRLRDLIVACGSQFATPRISELTWQEAKAKKGPISGAEEAQ